MQPGELARTTPPRQEEREADRTGCATRGELQLPGLADQKGEDENPAVISKLIDTVENDKESIVVREDSATNLRQAAQGQPEGELLDSTVNEDPNVTVRLEVDVNTVERRDPGTNWDEDSASRPIGVVHEVGPEEPPAS